MFLAHLINNPAEIMVGMSVSGCFGSYRIKEWTTLVYDAGACLR